MKTKGSREIHPLPNEKTKKKENNHHFYKTTSQISLHFYPFSIILIKVSRIEIPTSTGFV